VAVDYTKRRAIESKVSQLSDIVSVVLEVSRGHNGDAFVKV
jgi:hypothetical protein